MNALIGTPRGSSQAGSMLGHWLAGAVKRALGCAAGRLSAGDQSRPCQSIRWAGGFGDRPSHHTSPSSVRATLVKIVLRAIVSIATGLVSHDVPGATPK